MPSISSCPECHRDLTIPDVADPQQLLGCPLCDARFAAERVLAESVSFPPAAIVIGVGAPAPLTAEPEAKPEAAFGEQRAPTGLAAAESEPAGEAASVLGDHSTYDLSTGATNPPKSETSEAASDFDSFGQQAASMRVAPKTRRQTSMLGVLGQLLGMVLGGVAGLAIGYYVLVWLGGPRADFLQLRGKVPHWLRPPVRRHNDAGPSLPLADQPPTMIEPFASPERSGNSDDAAAVATNDDPSPRQAVELASLERAALPEHESFAEPTPSPYAPQVERLPPTAKPLPESYRGPRGFRLRPAAELQTALRDAERALRCPHCQMPPAVPLAAFTALGGEHREPDPRRAAHCDYCRGKPVLNLNADSYERLCELAEAATFARFDSTRDGDAADRDRCRDAAVALLTAIGGNREKSEVVGRLSGARLEDSQRQSNGIMLAGVVQQTQSEGDLFTIQLLLLGSGKVVTVVSRQSPEPPLARRDRVLVLGSIVDSPRDNLAGYVGDLPQVVWGGLPLKIAAAAR